MKTTDIWLASFLYLEDSSKLVGCSRNNHKTSYEFNYTQEEYDTLKVKFVKSSIIETKYTVEKLKDLAFQ